MKKVTLGLAREMFIYGQVDILMKGALAKIEHCSNYGMQVKDAMDAMIRNADTDIDYEVWCMVNLMMEIS